jgi:low temperature requirement protein LtrA
VAVALDYLAPLIGHMRGWRLSPEHFVERFGLIILIALGESVVALGAGAHDLPLDAGLITAALLGMTVVACLWWSYFDWVIYVAAARLAEATGTQRATLARDVYAYLHSAMVAGIVLFAYGLETTLEDTGHTLDPVPATALAGGVALYLTAHVALRLRIGGGLGRGRTVAAAITLALIPVATAVNALTSLAALSITCVALIAYEVLRYRTSRNAIRARHAPHPLPQRGAERGQ